MNEGIEEGRLTRLPSAIPPKTDRAETAIPHVPFFLTIDPTHGRVRP